MHAPTFHPLYRPQRCVIMGTEAIRKEVASMLRAKNACLHLAAGEMDYIRFGRGGKPLLMLPGVGDGLKTVRGMALPFALLYRKLAKDFTVYVFSRRRNLPVHFTTREMAEDLNEAMAVLGLKSAAVVGVSQGGMIAQWLAIDHPTAREVIARWSEMARRGDYRGILLDTAERSYSETRLKQIRREYAFLGSLGKPKSFARFLTQAESCVTHDAYAQLGRVACPTLVIGGTEDRIVTGAASREIAAQLSDAGETEIIAKAEADRLEGRGLRITEGIEAARKALVDAESGRDKLLERAKTLSGQIDELRKSDGQSVEEVTSKLDEVGARHSEVEDAITSLTARAAANASAKEALEALGERARKITDQYGEIETLAKTATGQLSGKERLSFETYLQARWFDRVIAAANGRFSVMTNGRFELERQKGQRSGSAQSGLGLDVRDTFTGKPRPASSLSGGESFKASLALALGLSDVVQAAAGGIQLDAMFVDEGFGTLDEESLALAVRTLTELSGPDKLVGIISHVEELRSSIDRKIVVEAGREGSKVRIEGVAG